MHALRSLVAWGAAVAWPLAAAAQPAGRAFDLLATLVATGDTLEVTDASGEPVTGRLLQLTSSSLTLAVEGEPRTWAVADVHLVRQRYRDPLWNGALIGAATGAVAGAVPVLVDCWSNDTGSLVNRCHSDGDAFLAWCTAGAAGGAPPGPLLDLSHASHRTVYEGGGPTVSLRPVLAPSSRGLLVTVRF